MSPPLGSPGPHLSEDDFLAIVGSAAPPGRATIEHLARCAHCMALYTDLATLRAEEAIAAGRDPVPARWIEAGRAVGVERSADIPPLTTAISGAGRRSPSVGLRVAIFGAAAAAAVLAVALGVRAVEWRGTREEITRWLREDSAGSLLYGEPFLPTPRGTRGNETAAGSGTVLDELTRRFNDGDRSVENTFWLVAGYLSLNDLNNAEAFLHETMADSGVDPRLETLAGILAWKRSALSEAEGHLGAALSLDRGPATLYNLALVRYAGGNSAAGDSLVVALTREFPSSPIARLSVPRGTGGHP